MTAVRRLAAEGRFDSLLIESTGIGEPKPVAASFWKLSIASGTQRSNWSSAAPEIEYATRKRPAWRSICSSTCAFIGR